MVIDVISAQQGQAWLKDDEATQCKQCQKEFSISRRKVSNVPLCQSLYLSPLANNSTLVFLFEAPLQELWRHLLQQLLQ